MSATLTALLRARAGEEPARIALTCADGSSLTFGSWAARADATANRLLANGLAPGDRVALLFDTARWIDYAITFMGVLAAGGVAVPLSTRQSASAVSVMTGDCAARWVLEEAVDTGPAVRPGVEPAPADLAQILYTSGTTGRPKGVAATHANLAYGHRPHQAHRMLAHSEHFLHAFPIGTNAGQMMLVNTLVAHPAALVAPGFDAEGFCALIERHRAGTVFLVPSMAADLLSSGAWKRHDLSSVVLLSSSADALPPHVAAGLPEAFPEATIVNYYTSTEAVPAQTTMIVDPARPHSVGRATDARDLRINGESGAPAPVGEIGEVWLRAPAAQRSYYRDPDASARVFVSGWTRMGDFGYLDADGYLYLVGRDADLLKSGGFKISALQIEAALVEHPGVADAAVLAVPHAVMGSMIATAVVTTEPVAPEELRRFLLQRLAGHEVPTRYAFVDTLPRNELGKVVKGELRELFTQTRGEAARPLATPDESALARHWSLVLGVPVVSGDDDFFALGGDSLKAAQLAARLSVESTFPFDHPQLSAQARALATVPKTTPAQEHEVPEGAGALSGVQEYWWRWMHATAVTRHMPPVYVAVRVEGGLDLALLERCLGELVGRHEALRTVFRDGRATVLDPAPVKAVIHRAAAEDEAAELAAELVREPYDVGEGPLLRAALIGLPSGADVMVLAAHHLVSDGWSAGVLLRELGVLYSAFGHGAASPLLKPVQFSSFVAFEQAEWQRVRPHWEEVLAGAPAVLPRLPGRAADVRTVAAESFDFDVPDRLVRELAADREATVAMAVAALWAATLGAWAGTDEVVLATPVTGRTRPELAAVVGCVFRWNLLRVAVGDPHTTLDEVRRAALAAGEHQFHHWARLHEIVPYPAYVRFESWGTPAQLPGLASTAFEVPAGPVMEWPLADDDPDLHPPELLVVERPGGALRGSLIYNRHAYPRATVAGLAAAFTALAGRA